MTSNKLLRSRLRAFFAPVALLAMTNWAHATPAENNAAMLRMATDKGCMACHSIEPKPVRADGLPPIAPAWREVAIKYRDDPVAYQRLTKTVVTGSDPTSRHWSGKTGAAAMPPNAAVISEADARMLVNWILVLVP